MDTRLPFRKALVPFAALGALALGGCVAVPAYGPGYDPYYAAPAPVVVRPAVSFGYYGYYGGPRYGYGHRHWR